MHSKYILFFLPVLLVILTTSCTKKLSEEEIEKKAGDLHQRILTIDTHCDTPRYLMDETWDVGVRHNPKERGSSKLDLPRMKEGGLDAAFFAVFVGQRPRTPENYVWARQKADDLVKAIKRMCDQYSGVISLATRADQASGNQARGLLSAYMGMENGFPIGKDITNVQRYYSMGIRYITLCHTKNNDICDSSTDRKGPEHNGLSEFGRQVVGEMNRLGMMVDISHVSDKSFYDVLQVSKAPVIASHSCARALCDNPRNLSDDMLKALAAKGGVMQMCLLSDYVKKPEPNPAREAALKALREKYGPWDQVKDEQIKKEYRNEYYDIIEKHPVEKATVQDVVDHIDHVVELVGIDYIGIGTDFDGGGGVIGCNDVSELPNITIELMKRGYSEQDIEKIWSGNILRVFRQVEQIAQALNKK